MLAGSKPVCVDLRKYSPAPEFQIDFIIGGPPCQTFSAAGRRAAGVSGTSDPRGTLFAEYVRLLQQLNPTGFLFENVYGITGAQQGKAWKDIQNAFKEIGYTIYFRILDTADYGVPQHRERLFIVGLREGNYFFPQPTHGPDAENERPFFSAGEAVADVDTTGVTESLGGQYGHLLHDIPPRLNYSFYTEKMGYPRPVFGWRSKFSDFLYKADPLTPVRTIKAQGGQYTGPFSWHNRPLTIEEFKRLQTFPETYELIGSRQVCIEQIGNSVPPHMARILAISILDQVFNVKLPFQMKYLPHEQELGFRQRKCHKTNDYTRKARKAMEVLAASGDQTSVAFSVSNHQSTRYLTTKFGWLKSKVELSTPIRIHYEFETKVWSIFAHNIDHGMEFRESFQIKIMPSVKSSLFAGLELVILRAGDFSPQTFTALWKAFEEKLNEITGIADLVQLNGYYQYSSKMKSELQFLQEPPKSLHWRVIAKIVNGIGVAKQMSDKTYQMLFDFPDPILPLFEQFRQLGYEVRNRYTNPQIKPDEYLIPYAFPTLTPRSVQTRKSLRDHLG